MPRPNRSWQPSTCLDEMEGRKVAVLGDMLELGPYEKRGHEMVGVRAAEVADELVTVGERARMIAAAARKRRLAGPQHYRIGRTIEQAIEFLHGNLSSAGCRSGEGFARYAHGSHRRCLGAALEGGS